jgi:peptide/nickel transport system substrate-binding protein
VTGQCVSPATRRQFLISSAAIVGSVALAACAAPAPPAAPTAKPAEPKPAAAATQPPEAAQPAEAPSGIKTVARNRTLMTALQGREGKFVDGELWNPYAVGANTSGMNQLLYEPLAYYSVFADKEILWLAESYEYSKDFKQLTIKTRPGIQWSDGQPFGADDVTYTLNTLKTLGPQVRWGAEVSQYVDSAKTSDPNTVLVTFKGPAPRFFDFVSYKFDIGLQIVPKHIFDGQDWTSFKNFDVAKGWPVTTGPWKVVYGGPEQKVIDRRDAWWGTTAGVTQLPKMERVILVPWVGEQQVAQALIANQLDYTYSLQPATWPTVFKANPKIITHTGQKPPYGYQDWWPLSLWVNNQRKPFDDKDIRWALSYFIDRAQLVEVAWSGASAPSPLPMPAYPPLKPYFDAAKTLLDQYDTNEYNPQKGEQLLAGKGWKKDAQGMWVDGSGARLKLEIIGSGTSGNAVGPVLPEQLKRHGVDASFSLPPDFGDRLGKGEYTGAINGHGGSVRDPYYTMRLYQSQSVAVPGNLIQQNLARWTNSEWDKLTDEVYTTDMNDKAKLVDLWKKAIAIWLPELPDIQLTQFHHRVPMNTTYWSNWPTEDNSYVNGALWHLTWGYVLTKLEPSP